MFQNQNSLELSSDTVGVGATRSPLLPTPPREHHVQRSRSKEREGEGATRRGIDGYHNTEDLVVISDHGELFLSERERERETETEEREIEGELV